MLCSYRRCPVRFSTPDAASEAAPHRNNYHYRRSGYRGAETPVPRRVGDRLGCRVDFGVGHEGPHQATTVVYWTDINGNGDPCPYLPIVLDNHSSTDRAAGPAPPA